MRTDRNEMGSRRRSTTGDNANEISRAVDAAMSGSGNCGVPDAAGAPSSRGDRANQKSQSRSGQRRKRRLIFESLGQRRVLAVITGAVFNDADGSMRQDPTEIRLESRLAFIDSNDNAILDSGESYAITDADGQFQFDNLDPGTYPVRLFNTSSGQASSGRGSSGQRQTYPTGAIQSALPTSFEAPIDAVLAGDQLNVLTAGSLHQINTSGTRTSQIPLGFEATGLVAAVSNPALGVSASMIVGTFDELGEGRSGIWLVRSGGDGPQLLHYSPNPHAFSSPSAAVGADGKGVVIEAGENSEDSGTVLAVQVTARSAENTTGEPISVQVTPTNATVPSNTQVLASQTSISLSGNDSTPSISSRTVFAWPVFATTGTSQTGFQSIPALKTSLWSNGAGSWIEGSETVIVGATELVSFDDQAGLLAVRYAEGDLGILDVDAGFAPLHQLSGVNGPSTFVTGEEAIASIRTNVDGDMLILHDIRSGEVLARQPLDLESIGQPVSVISGATFDSYLLVGDSGVLSIELEQPVAHYVQLNREDASQSILFGLQVDGENQAPQTRPHVEVSAIEDHRLTIDASEIASLVTDANHDRLVSLIVQEPQNGEVTISPDGAVRYMPNQDYNGPDSFAIGFHDGQSESQPIQFSVSVAAQPDAPSGIRFRGDAIPEHTEGRYEVGTIEIDDVDLNNHYVLNVLDSRFQVENGKLILVDGGLNYEHEHQIQLTLAGYDNEAGQYFSHDIIILVEDENDPIDEVYADLVPLAENQQGVFVATLGAIDEDEGQTITFSVDDPRFEVIGDELWLKPGESIDYETESVVVLNITADDNAGSTATTEIRVSIIDVPEAVTQISLSNETVLEFEAGATVGDVLLDGVPAADSYRLTVDDPRFEIDGSELKLLDDQWVRRSAAEQIELTITAQDNNANFDSISGTFVIEVLPNETPFHNDDDPYDVDGNGVVTPRDALAIINYLNLYGPGPVGPGDPGYGYDVNGDGQVTALDALLVINMLNSLQNRGTVGNGAAGNNIQPDGEQPGEAQPDTGQTTGGQTTGSQTPVSGNTTTAGQTSGGPNNSSSSNLSSSNSSSSTVAQIPVQNSPGSIGPVNDAPPTDVNADVTNDLGQASVSGFQDSLVPATQVTDQQVAWLHQINGDDQDPELAQAIDELLILLDRTND